MARNEWADRFVDNVVQRSQRDGVLGTATLLLTLVLPVLVGVAVLAYLFLTRPETFEGWSLSVAVEIALIAENCVAGYVLMSMTRRSRNHLSRDLDWMDALIGYAGSYGADTSGLEAIRAKAAKGAWGARYAVSGVLWAVSVVYLIASVAYFGSGATAYDEPELLLLALSYLFLMLQYLFAVGATTAFPSRHDRLQCEFTSELRDRCEGFGLRIRAMDRRVPKRHAVIRAVLYVVTLGLFSLPLLLWCNHHLNRHVRGQWAYESDLADEVISFEGGSGVEGVGSNQPASRVGTILNNLMRSVDGLLSEYIDCA